MTDDDVLEVQPFENFNAKYQRKGRYRAAQVSSSSVQVWQVVDRKTHDRFSMRVLKKTPRNKLKFHREVAILKECNGHPNLLHVRNAYEDDKLYYVVGDNLRHSNLLQALVSLEKKEKASVDAGRVAAVVASVLSGLNYLHDPDHPSKQSKTKIVHGNLHVKNILVPDETMLGNLTIVDFSSARMDGRHEDDDAADDDDSSSVDSSDEEKDDGKKKKKRKHKSWFHPPEYPETGPTAEGDMWALGVLTFLLLSGNYPFAKPSHMTQPIQDWHDIEDETHQKFILSLLEPDPEKRATAKEIAKSEAWFNQEAFLQVSQKNFDGVLKNLAKINQEHEFQVAVRSYVSTTVLEKSDRAHLDQVFRALDGDGSGTITKEELRGAMQQAVYMDSEYYSQVFDLLDQDGDKEIGYAEFMAFAENTKFLFEKKRLKAAFDAFDYSKTGYITADDLQNFSQSPGGSAAFRGEKVLSKRMAQEMIERADQHNKDGKISFGEFVDMMTGSSNEEADRYYGRDTETQLRERVEAANAYKRIEEIHKHLEQGSCI